MTIQANSILRPSHLGSTVFYLHARERVVAIVTEVLPGERANLALIRNGVHQAHVPDYAYDVPYAPMDPSGLGEPNTWHTRSAL